MSDQNVVETTSGDGSADPSIGVIRDGKAYVSAYSNSAHFPLEIGDTVYVVKPGFRAPLGAFIIAAAYARDTFALQWKSNNVQYDEIVEGKYLKRDPYGPS